MQVAQQSERGTSLAAEGLACGRRAGGAGKGQIAAASSCARRHVLEASPEPTCSPPAPSLQPHGSVRSHRTGLFTCGAAPAMGTLCRMSASIPQHAGLAARPARPSCPPPAPAAAATSRARRPAWRRTAVARPGSAGSSSGGASPGAPSTDQEQGDGVPPASRSVDLASETFLAGVAFPLPPPDKIPPPAVDHLKEDARRYRRTVFDFQQVAAGKAGCAARWVESWLIARLARCLRLSRGRGIAWSVMGAHTPAVRPPACRSGSSTARRGATGGTCRAW